MMLLIVAIVAGWVLGLATADYIDPDEPPNPPPVDPPEPGPIRDITVIEDDRPRDVHELGAILRHGTYLRARKAEDAKNLERLARMGGN